MIVSAQDATRSIWCSAEACEFEAEPGQRLCFRCIRKERVRYHVAPIIDPAASLRCCNCKAFKPQTEFSHCRTSTAARNYKSCECKACAATRRQIERATRTPEQIEAQRAKDRARGLIYRQRQRERKGRA